MCLILLAWRAHPDFPLVVAANRDEFFARPTAAADFWADRPEILAGRDLEGGGTWLGISRGGRFAGLTNYRDPASQRQGTPSRGALVADFLDGASSPAVYQTHLTDRGAAYNGYNLIFGNGDELYYQSNQGPGGPLLPGVYGLSNHLLDTPWPKVALGKSRLASALSRLPDDAGLLQLLRDDALAEDHLLPRTGVSLDWERLLSAAFVRSPSYGTRSSSVIVADKEGRVAFEEVSYGKEGEETGRERFRFWQRRT
ncbi:MAG: NRDE family protein [Rhodocyclaceae bacterium]|nr:NRDE family protein [Rhodocyclaceae bacterium]